MNTARKSAWIFLRTVHMNESFIPVCSALSAAGNGPATYAFDGRLTASYMAGSCSFADVSASSLRSLLPCMIAAN